MSYYMYIILFNIAQSETEDSKGYSHFPRNGPVYRCGFVLVVYMFLLQLCKSVVISLVLL